MDAVISEMYGKFIDYKVETLTGRYGYNAGLRQLCPCGWMCEPPGMMAAVM